MREGEAKAKYDYVDVTKDKIFRAHIKILKK